MQGLCPRRSRGGRAQRAAAAADKDGPWLTEGNPSSLLEPSSKSSRMRPSHLTDFTAPRIIILISGRTNAKASQFHFIVVTRAKQYCFCICGLAFVYLRGYEQKMRNRGGRKFGKRMLQSSTVHDLLSKRQCRNISNSTSTFKSVFTFWDCCSAVRKTEGSEAIHWLVQLL